MKTKLSENIRSLRKEHKMTQEQLAEIMQVSTGAVHKWEADLSTPDINYIMGMAELFSVSVDTLIGFTSFSNFKDDGIERMRALQQNRKVDEAKEEAQSLLRKYPNDFEVTYRCAKLYQMIGIESDDEGSASYAIELFKRALAFSAQYTGSDISETTIISDISECYIVLGKADKAIDILKKNNSDGRHNVSIGMIYANLLHSPKEAEYYLNRAFSDRMNGILNIMIGYSNVYLDLGDENRACRSLEFLIGFTESLRESENKIIYIDKINTALYSLLATFPSVIKDTDRLRDVLKKAYNLAIRFDSDPIYSAEGILFCENVDKLLTTYDSLGKTAFEAAERIIYDKDLPKEIFDTVTSVWEGIKNEKQEK